LVLHIFVVVVVVLGFFSFLNFSIGCWVQSVAIAKADLKDEKHVGTGRGLS